MLMDALYRYGLKPLLFQFHPDLVHRVFVKLGTALGETILGRSLIGSLYGAPHRETPIVVDGLSYQSPVLLAAGFDYNGYLAAVLWEMGFGGQEVGSVTALPCGGNQPPNLTRLVKSRSIQVYKGLRNDGVEAIIKRLRARHKPAGFVQGISIARTNSSDCADHAAGVRDYVTTFRRLNEEDVGDFYTINISCPNAFGGEDFAQPDTLRELLTELRKIPCAKPVYFKLPINRPWEEIRALLDVLKEFAVHGVVIGNLNKDYTSLAHSEELPSGTYRGGLSGEPCRQLSNDLIRRTRAYDPQMTIIGCGGVMTPEDALEKFRLGANLVQLISGMIFTGPHLVGEINQALGPRKALSAT